MTSKSLSVGLAMIVACASPPVIPPRPPSVVAPPPAQDIATADTSANTLASKVTKVTVYSDRARVTRRAQVQLPTEATVFAFRSLPGWVDDGSVQVSVTAGVIVDVRVDRRFLSKATDASWQRVEKEHSMLSNQLAALNDEIAVLDAQKQQIESIKAFSVAKITQDTTIGDVSVKSYGDVMGFISASLRDTAKARRDVKMQLDELKPKFDASARTVEDAKGLMKLEETTVLVTLQGTTSMPATVEITYMLPGVTWEPMHELRANTTDAKNVEVVSFAAVTQTSGEDWGGAELSFSTQSTTEAVNIPELDALTLGDTQTVTRTRTSKASSFTRAQSAFKGQNMLWNKVRQSAAERERENFEQVYQSNIEFLEVVQGRTVSIFESLAKRGTTAHFKAQAAQSVRGDGHPVRLLIGRSSLGFTQQIVAAPEQSLSAAHTVSMLNATGQSLLPGQVALYQDGTFLGMTDIEFVAKGERFSVFLSVADQLKITRQLDRKQSALIRKTRNQMQVVFVVTVENLSSEAASFRLADRIPVSENKDIRIDKVSITPASKPDSQGLLRWDLTLKPGEKREFRIGYQVEYPAELVIETNRRQQMDKARSPAPSPYAPSPSRARIEDQIKALEDSF
ncbi:MAG: mucoidy inhibitor MuiA family protein [Kofleriaceae bacterium]